jgi:hypothetical protein
MMAKRDRKNEEELTRLYDALAESVLESSESDLFRELRADGQDPDALAGRASQLIEAALKASAEARRRDARKTYESHVAALTARRYRIPATTAEQRAVLETVLGTNPAIRPAVFTLQHRDLKALSDDDVRGYLEKLAELGLLKTESASE